MHPRNAERASNRSRERGEGSIDRAAGEVKLKREYLYGSVLKEKAQNGEKSLKYRYDIEKVPDKEPSPPEDRNSKKY